MSKDVEDAKYTDLRSVEKVKFPRIVFLILLTEFCERFSYSGMRAFLTLYLRSKLGYTDDGATETYHIFSTFVYVFPIIGGILADNYLGKFRTILYMMFVYAAGNILVAVTAVPQLALPGRLCTLIGLLLITMGTGGIKPCVTAFGGDQFKLPEQESHLALYFSILYFTLCTGSLIAKTVSPILRSEVHCFGDKDCYSLAFGAPGLVVLASIVIFVSAKSKYVMKEPTGNVVVDFVKCVSLGLKNLLLNKNKSEKNAHWLDSTQHKYDKGFIKDIKKTLSILMLFTIMPVFWSLLDQMGSRWTLQATKMNGNIGLITVKPDQMQVMAPIFILILIPLSQKYIYPFLEKRNMLKNPLHKLILGGILAGFAFIASAMVEIHLKSTYPQLPQQRYSQLRIFNSNSCPITISNKNFNLTHTIPPFANYDNKLVPTLGLQNLPLKLYGDCIRGREKMFLMEENTAVSFFLDGNNINRFRDKVEKSKSGFPIIRFLVPNRLMKSNLTLYNERRKETEVYINGDVSQMEVFASTYTLMAQNETLKRDVKLESGGVYTVIISENNGQFVVNVIVITEPNSITMALLLPQFFIMSMAEVLFAVTGNEFAFKESPESMRAVMSATWLFTDAVGNVIIIIITRLFVNYQQETQSFIYSGMMFVAVIVLYYLSKRYQSEERCKSHCLNEQYIHVRQAEELLEH